MYSFADHKKIVDLYPYIRRVCDITTPNLPTAISERSEERFNRTIPTLLCPWEHDTPSVNESTICLTSDLADRGVRLILSQPFRAEAAVIGYWVDSDEMPEPWYFIGTVRRNKRIGGGFWAVGIELTEYANSEHQRVLADLREIASKLLPPSEAVL